MPGRGAGPDDDDENWGRAQGHQSVGWGGAKPSAILARRARSPGGRRWQLALNLIPKTPFNSDCIIEYSERSSVVSFLTYITDNAER